MDLEWRRELVPLSDSFSHLFSLVGFVRIGHYFHYYAFSQAVSPARDARLISTYPLMSHLIINLSKKFAEFPLPSPSENVPPFFLCISLGHYICHNR